MEDLVLKTFEQAAEHGDDVTADIYRRYYQRCPRAEALMSHVDAYMQGRMMEEVLNLLMTEPGELPDGYLAFETATHASYGVLLAMYPDLLHAVRETVRAAVGADWNDACDRAWDQRTAALLAHIAAAAPSTP